MDDALSVQQFLDRYAKASDKLQKSDYLLCSPSRVAHHVNL